MGLYSRGFIEINELKASVSQEGGTKAAPEGSMEETRKISLL